LTEYWNNSKKDIDVLIEIGNLYKNKDFNSKNYSFDVKGIYNMIPSLLDLKSLVGLATIKKSIINQIIYFAQGLHNSEFNNMGNVTLNNSIFDQIEGDMCHTIIQGPPGSGKTILGKILAKIYLSLGVIEKDTVKIAKRSDLIGEYVGHTAIKTQKIINESLGGVLFIDEAYSLGSAENSKNSSFDKECIDTINQNLSDHKGEFVCIIAGYENELENRFFALNPGLERRFVFRYTIDKYTHNELLELLLLRAGKENWIITNIF